MLWNIAIGGREDRRAMNPKMRLYIYVCQTNLLDETSLVELFNFIKSMMNTDLTIQEAHRLILSYTYVVLSRERSDGSLRGMMFVGVDRRLQENGNPYTIIRVGLSYFQLNYRGGPYLYSVTIYFFLKELLAHPLTPLYVVMKSFSYKSYSIMTHAIKHSYPRYDEETPELVRDIINSYGLQAKAPNETYNMDTFVLERVRNNLKRNLTILDDSALKDPHIKFFVKRNPLWAEGHQLILLGCVQWRDIFAMIFKIITKAVRGRKGSGGGKKRTHVLKRSSFQLETANEYLQFVQDSFHHCDDGDLENFDDLDIW